MFAGIEQRQTVLRKGRGQRVALKLAPFDGRRAALGALLGSRAFLALAQIVGERRRRRSGGSQRGGEQEGEDEFHRHGPFTLAAAPGEEGTTLS